MHVLTGYFFRAVIPLFLLLTLSDWQVPSYEYPTDSIPEYTSILVPNVDNTRTEYIMNAISKQGKPVLLIGEPVSPSNSYCLLLLRFLLPPLSQVPPSSSPSDSFVLLFFQFLCPPLLQTPVSSSLSSSSVLASDRCSKS